MRLCLFIGHHKVGSTALQDHLARNAGRLARAGILYPAVESEGLALLLRQVLDPDDDGPDRFNAREPHNALVFRIWHEISGTDVPRWHPGLPSVHQMLLTIANQVRFLQPKAVILCAETFSGLAARPAQLARIAKLFAGAEVSLHCTLRRPDDHLASWHAQRLRFGDRLGQLSAEGFDGYPDSFHVDYTRILKPWRAAFPEARLSLRRYEDVLDAGGSIEDFHRESRLTFPKDLLAARRLNPSLHRGLIELGRRATLAGPPRQALDLVEALIRLSGDLRIPPTRDVELFGPANRLRLRERFAPVAADLAEIAQRDLFPDVAQIADCRPIPEVEAFERLVPEVLPRLPPALAEWSRHLAGRKEAA